MARQIVSDDNKPQVLELVLLIEFAAQCRKRFDDAHQVLVRTDTSRIQQEWVSDQISLGNQLAIGCAGVAM
jgi:hypothetical protein